MAIEHCLNDLQYDLTRYTLWHELVIFEISAEFSAQCGLHYHDELFAFYKRMMELDDIFML